MRRAGYVTDVQPPADGHLTVLQRLPESLQRREPVLRELVEEEHAEVGEADLAGRGVPPPPTRPGEEMVWCGARKGRRVTSGTPGGSRPATLWMRVISTASSGVR